MDVLALLGIQQGKRGLVMPWLLWLVLVLVWSPFSHRLFHPHFPHSPWNTTGEERPCYALAAMVSLIINLLSFWFSHNLSSFSSNFFALCLCYCLIKVFPQVFAWGCHLCGCDCCLHGRSFAKNILIFHEKENWWRLMWCWLTDNPLRCIQRPITYYPCWSKPFSRHLPGKKLLSLYP